MPSFLSDPNQLALWLVVLSCAVALGRTVAQVAAHGLGRAALDAFVTLLFVGGVAAGGHWLAPRVAGYLGLAAWGAAILAPNALAATAFSRSLRRDFRTGAALYGLLALLRPLGGFRAQRDYFRALDWLASGHRRAGLGLLARLQSDPALGPLATIERLTADGDWAGVRRFVEGHGGPPAGALPLLPRYLRALGELGEVEALVAALVRHRPSLGRRPPLLLQGLLFAFAFGGRVDAVSALLGGPLAALDERSRGLWLGTAELAAGAASAGLARLTAARARADAQQLEQIDRRLAAAPSQSCASTSAAVGAELDELARVSAALARSVPGFGSRRFPLGTALLTAAILGAFAVEVGGGGSLEPDTLERLGALVPARVAAGEWRRIVTALFLHMGPVHLVMNLLASIPIGIYLERRLGAVRTVATLLVSGAVPMAAHVGFWALGGEAVTTVGASGAVMGGGGVAGAILLRAVLDDRLPEARRWLRSLLVLIVVQTLIDLLIPAVDFLGHALGLAVGFCLGAVQVRLGAPRTLLVGVPAIAAALGGHWATTWLPWRQPLCGPGEVTMCELACRLGVLDACGALGQKLALGEELPADPERARALLERACAGSVREACNALGIARDGSGRRADARARSRAAFARACELGSRAGCHNLGTLLAFDGEDAQERARGRGLLAAECRDGDGASCDALATLCNVGDDAACTAVDDQPPEPTGHGAWRRLEDR